MTELHCVHCRRPAPAEAPCPDCGAYTRAPAWAPPAPVAPRPADLRRPLPVSIIAGLGLVSTTMSTLLFVAILTGVSTSADVTDAARMLMPLPPAFVMVFSLALGFVGIATYFGMWQGYAWAWWVAIALWAYGVLETAAFLTDVGPNAVFGAFVNLLLIGYWFNPAVKRWHGVAVDAPRSIGAP